jgi:Fur family ferric uptake transcriptional regulator
MHHARAKLRDSGYRLTPQRAAVWEVVREHAGHMTVEEVTAAARARLPEINVSTVYRTLELLVSLDLVTETKLGTARSYFEVSPEPVHHHFVCTGCGAVGHFGDGEFAALYRALAEREGFAAERMRATVSGLCRICRAQTGGDRAHP